MLIFIYYYKGILSINDIQTLFKPITDKYFGKDGGCDLERIYNEVFGLEEKQVEVVKKDVSEKFKISQETFKEVPEEEQEFLQIFSFICQLSFDVYVKQLLVEKLIDGLKENENIKKVR